MKKLRSKLLIITLLLLLLCNFIMPNYVFAGDYTEISKEAVVEEEQNMTLKHHIPVLGGVVELFMDVVKLGVVIPGMIVCGINTGLRWYGWKR